MTEACIRVDLQNPGQVFACLGFLEAADVLLGDAEGGFDWTDAAEPRFLLQAAGAVNPVEVVLAFLADARLELWTPMGYSEKRNDDDEVSPGTGGEALDPEVFPSVSGDRMSLPIRLRVPGRPPVLLGHWADGSSRENFKLYAGNRSAADIARAMLFGVRDKPKKTQKLGVVENKGIAQLLEGKRNELIERPFHVPTPMGGSFNFDPRGAWTAIDAGYSLNDQNHEIAASPVVEFLAAWGLEHARPRLDSSDKRLTRYSVWSMRLPPILARCAIVGGLPAVPSKHFRFRLNLSGKNKVITIAIPETHYDKSG
jgi:CRISPR-associated protein Csx14